MDYLLALTGKFFGFFLIPITALAIGFIVKKSTGKSWGYYLASILLALQLVMILVVSNFKNQGV